MPEPTSTSYAAILAAPAARFLRELDIDEISFTAPRGGIHPTIAMLTRLGVPAALRKLALLAEVFDPISLGPIPPDLWSRLAAIEELTIRVAQVEPGKIVLPRLTTLALATALTDAVLTAVAEAECPRLTSVQLDSVTQDIAVSAARMQPLFSHWATAGTPVTSA